VGRRFTRLTMIRSESALAMRRAKGVRCDQIEESLIAKANGFTKKIKKATASGKVVTVDEYFPPDVQAQKFYLQHNRPEVYREVREVKQLVGVEEGFLNFLQRLDDKARQERETGNLPQLIEQQVEDAQVIEDDTSYTIRGFQGKIWLFSAALWACVVALGN
jgi:hypothetical protein